MSERKERFTPGPWLTAKELWAIKPDAYACSNQVYTRDGMMIAACTMLDGCEQDAALIACAPEMHALLERLANGYKHDSPTRQTINALLARARGEAE